MPDPVLLDGKRLDDVAGRRFVVITSAPLDPSQRDELTRRGAVVVTAHPGTELALWLQAGRARAAVVRPDRTVMCAGRDVDEIISSVSVFAIARSEASA